MTTLDAVFLIAAAGAQIVFFAAFATLGRVTLLEQVGNARPVTRAEFEHYLTHLKPIQRWFHKRYISEPALFYATPQFTLRSRHLRTPSLSTRFRLLSLQVYMGAIMTVIMVYCGAVVVAQYKETPVSAAIYGLIFSQFSAMLIGVQPWRAPHLRRYLAKRP